MRCRIALIVIGCCAVAAAEEPPQFAPSGAAFLKQHCVKCHSDVKPEGSLSLVAFTDNASVVRNRKVWLTMLKRIEAGEMPPEDSPRPPRAEIDALSKSILGILDHHDRHAKPDPGRVTVRRLNRVEYANTVRDLVGVDFNPAEDFPADDIGYGFDNIGDVLTLSPVLMERYLAAAESIAERAILPNPPSPPKRFQAGRYLEPAGGDVPGDKFRRMTTQADQSATAMGPLHTPYQVPADGEYIFRVRLYKESVEGQTVKVALLAHGNDIAQGATDEEAGTLSGPAVQGLRPFVILKTADVQATESGKAETLEVRIPPDLGLKRVAVALVKPAADQPPAVVHVEWLNLEGPLDTRPASHRKLLAVTAEQATDAAKTSAVLDRWLLRAYRRPPQPAEKARLEALVSQLQGGCLSWEVAMQRALTAVLSSPKFLFRWELDDQPAAPEHRALDEYQLASRLSYFLWSTMPDEEVLQLAQAGKLAANLDAQVVRMLKDQRAQTLVENFGLQWLQLQRLNVVAPDAKLFPAFNERLRSAMHQETVLFMAEVLREDRPILDLLDADFTYLNEPLAQFYGIVDTNGNLAGQKPTKEKGQPIRGPKFVRVSLGNGQRGGLPTQASILTVTSNPTRTSPVKRGRWILEQILGDPPPPPPPDAPLLEETEQAALSGSLRQRMEQHRSKPACANCHARMDPIGFAFENYDAIGRYRTKDGEFPIETAGNLPDGTGFAGPSDFKQILRDRKDQFTRCLVEKLMIYGLGRGLEYYDRPVIERTVAETARGDYRVSSLIQAIVRSEPFRLRRGLKGEP